MRSLLPLFFVVLAGAVWAQPAFGGSASADFNGDGLADLAVGVPGEDVGTVENAGAVNMLYGSVTGLSAMGNQFWHQNSRGIKSAAEARDDFGSALAAGDFDGDGYADLAVGVPGENVGTGARAGAVNVLYGGLGGLSAAGNQFWHQDSDQIKDVAEEWDAFRVPLASRR